MGRDKALLPAPEDRAPLWGRQRRGLEAAGAAEIFLSARPDQPWVADAAKCFSGVVHDTEAGVGPLAGIAAALVQASHSRVTVLAVDLPHMSAEFLRELFSRSPGGVVPVWPDGRVEPLCAIYPREALASARRAIAEQRFAVRDWVADLERANLVTRFPLGPGHAPLFRNWNEPRDVTP